MSGAGTSLFAFKAALVDRLVERPGLAGVNVYYAQDDGELGDEAVWLRDADTEELKIPNLRAGRLQLDEKYDLDVVVQVALTQGQSQREADARVDEIFGELQRLLAEMPEVVEDIQWARPYEWKHRGGQLGQGHGSRLEVKVRVHARME